MKVGLYDAVTRLTKTKYAALWHNFLYGVTTVYSIAKIADPSLFPDKQNQGTESGDGSLTHSDSQNLIQKP